MAAPTAYVVQPRVTLGGQAETGLASDLLSALVEETADGLYRCEVRFNNWGPRAGRIDYLYFDGAKLDFGKEIALAFGAADAPQQIFSGRISAIEAEYSQGGVPSVAVLAEDRLQDLRMTRRTRTFEDLSDAGIMQTIAAEYSLSPQLQLDGPTHKIVAQVNQSDLAFVRDRARACSAEVWIEGTTLHAAGRTERNGGSVRLAYGVNLIAFTVRADLAHQRSEIGVGGWDVAAKSAIVETAGASAVASELGSDRGGGAILEAAFATRKERIVHTVPLSNEEARAAATARYRERARRFVTGTGLADGNAAIRVGCTVELSALGRIFDGSYYVARVQHLYDLAGGFRTEFDVERAGVGQG